MSFILTNGQYFITTNENGGIIKTPIAENAQLFSSVNSAMRKMRKAPSKCKNYYIFNTENNTRISGTKKKKNRKTYSDEERRIIYNRSDGRCALCGQRLLLENMTLDHIVPLAMGGEDNMENLQASCFACNQFKGSIVPDDFIEKISQIFIHQIDIRNKNDLRWKIIHKMLSRMI